MTTVQPTERGTRPREATGPPLAPLPASAHLLEPVLRWASEEPDRPIAAVRRGDRFVDVTARELADRIRTVAKGLIASGVEPGDRVALMSHTRIEWVVIDYAILAVGGVTVPIYETSSAEQIQWIVGDSGAVLTLVETPEMRAAFDEISGEVPGCREALVIDDGALDVLAERGRSVDDATLDERIAGLAADQLATIVYTSGTTGRPKGCMQTHRNLRTNVIQNVEALRSMLRDDEEGDAEVSFLFLPLAHTLAKIIALVSIEWGAKLAFATDLAHLQEEMPLVRPTLAVAVPRVFEKVINAARQTAASAGRERIFARAEEVAVRWSREQTAGRRRLRTTLEHAVMDRLVYRKLRAVFGGRMRLAVSGGGPLGERLTHLYNGAGLRILEGYGLTETSPVLTVNTDADWRPGTVGRPIAGTTIRIAEDGEILAKGPQVFGGYWRNEAATAEVLGDDGWLHTGDIGELDDDGYLRITGRKKDILVTAAGKNVAPAPLEDRLSAHPLISQAVVVGDQRPFIAALIAVDEEALRDWADRQGLGELQTSMLLGHERLRAELQAAVDAANRSVSKAESIRKFAILPRDLSVDSGELTPTLKVRRAAVARSHAELIESLYA